MQDIKDNLLTTKTAIRIAVSSGHGIGKSALVAWILLWSITTYPDSRAVVTANTDSQLKSKTWPEVQKWFHKFILKDLFICTATTLTTKICSSENVASKRYTMEQGKFRSFRRSTQSR